MKASEATRILETVHSACSLDDYINRMAGLIKEKAKDGKNSIYLWEVRDSANNIPEPSPLVASKILDHFKEEGFHLGDDGGYPIISWDWHDEEKLSRSQRITMAVVEGKVGAAVLPINERLQIVEHSQIITMNWVSAIILLLVLPYCHLLWSLFGSPSLSWASIRPAEEYGLQNSESPKLPNKQENF